jgi:phosphomannomutase
MTPRSELSSIFKAYDVRGIVPDELDAQRAFVIGAGFARFVREAEGAKRLIVGRDMRASGIELSRAVIAGACSQGAHVIDIGMCSTDLLYFATGHLDAPGVMLTASHNPAKYNGLKFCLAKARPISQQSGLDAICRYGDEFLSNGQSADGMSSIDVEEMDLLAEFADHVRSFIDPSGLKAFSIVADTANGMGGLVRCLPVSRHTSR